MRYGQFCPIAKATEILVWKIYNDGFRGADYTA